MTLSGTAVFAALVFVGVLNTILMSYNLYHLLAYLYTRKRKHKAGTLPSVNEEALELGTCEKTVKEGSLSGSDEKVRSVSFATDHATNKKMNDNSQTTNTTESSDSSDHGEAWVPDPNVEYPKVTVQACVYNEMGCIEGLIKNLAKLQWPSDRLQIQILDDSTMQEAVDLVDSDIADLRSEGYPKIEHRRREQRTGYKGGNLLHHFPSVRGQFVALFDSDFLPYPDFLLKTIPHFYNASGEDQEDIGLVQGMWDHFNQADNILMETQGLIQNFHFVVQQNCRCRMNSFIPFNGTAGVWRTKAIEKSGGWNYDTVTEDLDLACRASLAKYKLVYIEDVTVPSELPPTMMAYKRQQRRWTQGHIQVARKILGPVWKTKEFTLKLKMDITHCVLYKVDWFTTFTTLVLLPLLGFVQLTPLQGVVLAVLGAYSCLVPSALLFATLWDKKYSHPHMSFIERMKRLSLLPFFFLLGVGMSFWQTVSAIEGSIQNDIPFATTPKNGKSKAIDLEAMDRSARIDDMELADDENKAIENGQEYKEWNYEGWDPESAPGPKCKFKRRPPGKLSKSFPKWAHYVELLLAFYFILVGLFFENVLFTIPFMLWGVGFLWVCIPLIRTDIINLCSARTNSKESTKPKEEEPKDKSLPADGEEDTA